MRRPRGSRISRVTSTASWRHPSRSIGRPTMPASSSRPLSGSAPIRSSATIRGPRSLHGKIAARRGQQLERRALRAAQRGCVPPGAGDIRAGGAAGLPHHAGCVEAPGAHRRAHAGVRGRASQHGDREALRPRQPGDRSTDRLGQGHGLGRRRHHVALGRRHLAPRARPALPGHIEREPEKRAPHRRRRLRRAGPTRYICGMNARPTDCLAIAVAQLNPTVGDVAGNAEKARAARGGAAREGADLVAFPELFLCGYPPEDLVLKPALQAACRSKIEELARETADGGPALLIGTPWAQDGKLYNAYCLLDRGAIAALRFKVDLPNYGVFDEKRVFVPGPMPGPVNFRGVRLGLPICEDIWGAEVVETLAETGAELLIVPNGSPYWRDKDATRLNIAVARVTESDLPVIYINQVGGQDELVFDGASFALHADRSLAFQLPAFRETLTTVRWQRTGNGWRCLDGAMAKPEA